MNNKKLLAKQYLELKTEDLKNSFRKPYQPEYGKYEWIEIKNEQNDKIYKLIDNESNYILIREAKKFEVFIMWRDFTNKEGQKFVNGWDRSTKLDEDRMKRKNKRKNV